MVIHCPPIVKKSTQSLGNQSAHNHTAASSCVYKTRRLVIPSPPYHCFPVTRSRKSLYYQKLLILLNKRIKKLEHKLDCGDADAPKSKLSLKHLKQRVERLEKKVKNQSQHLQLKLSTCLKFLLPEARHWHNISTLLEVPEPTLEQIGAVYPGDCQQCVREMIKSWLKQVDPPPSWKNLAEVVHEINPSLAKKILNYAAVDTIN